MRIISQNYVGENIESFDILKLELVLSRQDEMGKTEHYIYEWVNLKSVILIL